MTLDAERWARLRAIFDDVVSSSLAEQSERVAKATDEDPELGAELESLLRASRVSGDRFEHIPVDLDRFDDVEGVAPEAGSRIGPYRITREIGRGGMGTVLEAVRDDAVYTKRVALKMIASGRDTGLILRRFQQERQILARLVHKNIATLLDGGVTDDGRPYFAMEYVEGERIDRYCERQRLGVAARLQLFRQVCAAVQYAHQNLVVHRDIKPSNVLVDSDGTVKLLDFGIAKLIDPVSEDEGLTETGMLPMTTSHASPEQLRSEAVSTATDIYLLGVLLYELIAGRPPFHHGNPPLVEIRRRVLEESPIPPSRAIISEYQQLQRLPRSATAELDQIVLMALRKEPGRRYASADQLSQDLLRLMTGLPVQAQPDSLSYRARKFVGRNRAAVAAVSVVFLTLLVGLAGSLWQSQRVQRERAKAEAVSRFLAGLLLASSPDVTAGDKRNTQRTVKDVLDAASLRLETEDLSAHPEVRATLLRIIGRSYLSQGQYELAEKNLRAALAAQVALQGDDSPETLETLVPLAQLALSRADYPVAEEIYQQRLTILRREQRRGRIPPEVLAGALNDFGVLRRARGDSKEAEGLLREALALRSQMPAEAQTRVGQTESVLILTLLDQGKFADAEADARKLVAGFRELPNPDAPELCSGLTILGSVLMERGDLVEAEQTLREAETRYRALYDSNYVAIYDNVRLQAQVLYAMGRLIDAEAAIDRTLQKYRQYARPQYISFATALTIKGLILNKSGRSLEAETVLREAARLRADNLPPGHFMVALTKGALGEILVSRGRYSEAEPLLRSSYESLQRSQAMENPRVSSARSRLAALYTAWNRPDELARLK